ncbi:MAG: hypothetical protein J5507_07075 [Clostridia bacterium]|nr:hypothetical protein [Clostridia bacterium]
MKNLKIVKKLLIIMMSIALVLTVSTLVYAADEDPFLELTATNTNSSENTSLDTNTTNTNTNTSNSLFTETQNSNTINNSSLVTNSTTNTNNSVNRSVTNTDTLAKTGLSDSNGIVALIVVLCAVSAIYSYKKVNDYKKI